MSDSLRRITALARLMQDQHAAVTAVAAALAEAKAALARTQREDLPELLREVGLSSVQLDTGESITVRDDVAVSIPPEKRAAAFRWLEEHGYGGIIKTDLTVHYSRSEHDAALLDAERVHAELGREAQVEDNVHPQTLRAFVRERLEAGEAIPFDLFGIHQYSEAKITAPKR